MFLCKIFPRNVLNKINRLQFCDTRCLAVGMQKYSTGPSLSADISFTNNKFNIFIENLRQEFYQLKTSASGDSNFARIRRLSPIVNHIEQRGLLLKNLESLKDFENEDEDMKELVKEEREVYSNLLKNTESKLMQQLLELTDTENCSSLFLEISAGVGGQEAMLFASELYEMYCTFILKNGWEYELLDEDRNDIGGLRNANIIVYARDAYNLLKYEAGVHRVQRVPATEKSGRTHTSTASVAVIPRPDDIDVTINEKDLIIETKRASGAGGQHVNTTDSAVRIVHIPTGISVENQTDRSQIKNKELALKRLQAKIYQQQVDSQEAQTHAVRKAQKGTSNRNEKIRTYNYVQDRVTDHRLTNGTMHNLKDFLSGGDQFVVMIRKLVEYNRKNQLSEMISQLK